MHTALYYIQTNVFCVIVLAISFLILRTNKSVLPARRLVFNQIFLPTFLICVTDITAWLFNGKGTLLSYYITYVSNLLFYFCITWVGYLWLSYVEIRTSKTEEDTKKKRFLESIPLIIMGIILALNPFTKWLFSVDPETGIYSRGNLIVIHWLVSWGYLLWATIKVIVTLRKTSSTFEKRELTPLIFFIAPPVIAAILQMIFYGITSTQCGITLSILILIMTFFGNEISTDTLTGLNNRRAFDNYLNEIIQRDNISPTVFMCDVNNFKTINDTLGHSTGDRVLKRIAKILKTSCGESSSNPFLFRYGGDEFVIFALNLSAYESEEIRNNILRNLEEANKKAANDLSLSISIGEASGICSSLSDIEMLISVADADMYKNKQSYKAASVLKK